MRAWLSRYRILGIGYLVGRGRCARRPPARAAASIARPESGGLVGTALAGVLHGLDHVGLPAGRLLNGGGKRFLAAALPLLRCHHLVGRPLVRGRHLTLRPGDLLLAGLLDLGQAFGRRGLALGVLLRRRGVGLCRRLDVLDRPGPGDGGREPCAQESIIFLAASTACSASSSTMP